VASVADAMDRFEVHTERSELETKPADVRVHGSQIDIVFAAPDVLAQLPP
jgi:hypothetical protein